ncbi:MAG: hypothetical protein, partial [Olavius algarvensis Gamma 1 endosymbiont]
WVWGLPSWTMWTMWTRWTGGIRRPPGPHCPLGSATPPTDQPPGPVAPTPARPA